MFIRELQPQQRKEPLQLELFQPYEYGYQFKVLVTNSTLSTRKLLRLHNGRGAQEGIFAELKSQVQMDYIPSKRLIANQTWLLAAVLAHNLNRELQMSTADRERATTEKRAPLGASRNSAPCVASSCNAPGDSPARRANSPLTLSPAVDPWRQRVIWRERSHGEQSAGYGPWWRSRAMRSI